MCAIVTGLQYVEKVSIPQWLWYIAIGFIAFHELYTRVLDKVKMLLIRPAPKTDQPRPSRADRVATIQDKSQPSYQKLSGNQILDATALFLANFWSRRWHLFC